MAIYFQTFCDKIHGWLMSKIVWNGTSSNQGSWLLIELFLGRNRPKTKNEEYSYFWTVSQLDEGYFRTNIKDRGLLVVVWKCRFLFVEKIQSYHDLRQKKDIKRGRRWFFCFIWELLGPRSCELPPSSFQHTLNCHPPWCLNDRKENQPPPWNVLPSKPCVPLPYQRFLF